MELVIDIPEDLKKMIFDDEVFDIAHSYRLAMCVKNGTPLPKGHGRLIDEKEVKKMIEEAKVNSEHSKTFAENIIKFTLTIIEADKARK